jgi:hypothetical protein
LKNVREQRWNPQRKKPRSTTNDLKNVGNHHHPSNNDDPKETTIEEG